MECLVSCALLLCVSTADGVDAASELLNRPSDGSRLSNHAQLDAGLLKFKKLALYTQSLKPSSTMHHYARARNAHCMSLRNLSSLSI